MQPRNIKFVWKKIPILATLEMACDFHNYLGGKVKLIYFHK